MRKDKDIKYLEKILKRTNKCWLAWQLGYTSSTVIDQWLRRGYVPKHKINQIRESSLWQNSKSKKQEEKRLS